MSDDKKPMKYAYNKITKKFLELGDCPHTGAFDAFYLDPGWIVLRDYLEAGRTIAALKKENEELNKNIQLLAHTNKVMSDEVCLYIKENASLRASLKLAVEVIKSVMLTSSEGSEKHEWCKDVLEAINAKHGDIK